MCPTERDVQGVQLKRRLFWPYARKLIFQDFFVKTRISIGDKRAFDKLLPKLNFFKGIIFFEKICFSLESIIFILDFGDFSVSINVQIVHHFAQYIILLSFWYSREFFWLILDAWIIHMLLYSQLPSIQFWTFIETEKSPKWRIKMIDSSQKISVSKIFFLLRIWFWQKFIKCTLVTSWIPGFDKKIFKNELSSIGSK